MTKRIEINGEVFEVIHSSKTDALIMHHERDFKYRTLYNFYDNPSVYKREIWEEWYDWYRDTDNVACFEVTSGNTFSFTIGALYINEQDEIAGYIRITKDHNILYLKKGE